MKLTTKLAGLRKALLGDTSLNRHAPGAEDSFGKAALRRFARRSFLLGLLASMPVTALQAGQLSTLTAATGARPIPQGIGGKTNGWSGVPFGTPLWWRTDLSEDADTYDMSIALYLHFTGRIRLIGIACVSQHYASAPVARILCQYASQVMTGSITAGTAIPVSSYQGATFQGYISNGTSGTAGTVLTVTTPPANGNVLLGHTITGGTSTTVTAVGSGGTYTVANSQATGTSAAPVTFTAVYHTDASSPYLPCILAEFGQDAMDCNLNYPSTTVAFRQALVAVNDGSVLTMDSGMSSALADDLGAAPDAISPLTGQQLISQKVLAMGFEAGAWGTFSGNTETGAGTEFNFNNSIPATQYVLANMPPNVPMFFGNILAVGSNYSPPSGANQAISPFKRAIYCYPTWGASAISPFSRASWGPANGMFMIFGASYQGTPVYTFDVQNGTGADSAGGIASWTTGGTPGQTAIYEQAATQATWLSLFGPMMDAIQGGTGTTPAAADFAGL